MFVGSVIVQVTARHENIASTYISVLTPKRSHHSDPRLIQPRYIASHEFEDFGRVRAIATRAFIIDLAAKLLGQRPSHSIGDKPALDPEDYVPKEGHSASRANVAPYPLSGERLSLEKTRERSAALS